MGPRLSAIIGEWLGRHPVSKEAEPQVSFTLAPFMERFRHCFQVDLSPARKVNTIPRMPTRPPAVTQSPGDPILLFDGACGFCSAAVQTVLRHDRKDTLRFASLHGQYGLDFRARHPELQTIDSMVWLRPSHGQAEEFIAVRSDAALLTAEYLGGRFQLAAVARFIPKSIRDAAYDLLARHRHRFSGSPQECLIPTLGQRDRFLA